MRKLILSFSVLILCLSVRAQFSVALVGGPQMNTTTPAFTLLPDTVTKGINKHTGLNFGFIGNVAFNKKQSFFFRTGVLYSARGSQVIQHFDTANVDFDQGPYYVQATTNLKLNYIDVPVQLLLKLRIKGKTKFLIGGGVQGSLFYSGSTNFNTIKAFRPHPDSAARFSYMQVIDNDLPVGNTNNKYQVLHFSANALTGFEFGRVFLTVNYNNGLTEFFKSDDKSFKHQTIGAHFGIFLEGSKTSKKISVVKDKDKDGISDNLDACPDLAGTLITNGCPDKDGDGIADQEDNCPDIAGTAKYKGCLPPDRDKDGVIDEEDKCPDLAGLQKYNGCPIPDTDKDGVNDDEDKCPTVAGYKDNHGCPKVTKEQQQKVSYAAKRIQFEFKKADLSASSYPQLDEVVNILKNNPTLKLKVEGHTSGPVKESNTILSQQRANSVKDYFVKKGIEESRISSIGFGSSRPISKNGNKVENPIDRRVEMIIY